MVFNNLLPDWKGALNNFYEEKVKATLEQKSSEYKSLLEQFKNDNKRFQNAVLIILLTGLTITNIHYFWQDD